VTLDWSYEITSKDSPSDYQNIDGFRIYRRSLSGGGRYDMVSEVQPGNRTFTDDSAPYAKLEYKVVAFDGNYESPSSTKEVENESPVVRWILINLWIFGGITILIAIAVVILVSTIRSKRKQKRDLFNNFFLEE
jgi:hypothetical protein